MTKFLALTSDLLARITLTLISSFAITGCFQKVKENLFCVTNRCIKVTSKVILPSVSRFKFRPPYKSRVKVSQLKLVTKQFSTY